MSSCRCAVPSLSPLHMETLTLDRLAYHLPLQGKTEIELEVVRLEGVRNGGGQRTEESSPWKT